jgi:RimJ/RimL family protein N-acetyltransferase
VPDATRRNEFGQPVGDPVPGWTGALAPAGRVLRGRSVVLRPLVPGDAEALLAAYRDQPEADWTYLPVERPTDLAAMEAVIASRLGGPDLPYGVLVDDVVVGMASLMRIDTVNGVIEIGWVAFGTALQRTVGSTEAQRLLIGHAFDDLGFRRLEWKCDALNEPSMRAAARLGYTYEGTFRQAVVTKGRNRDTAWWSITDAEWPAIRELLDQWLDPSNFDDSGQQRARLSP